MARLVTISWNLRQRKYRCCQNPEVVNFKRLLLSKHYIDRESGGRLGVFETTASDNMASYLRPQECGNHTHVRWAEVKDKNGRGLRFEGDDLSLSVLPYSPDMIDACEHPNELPQSLSTYIRVDLAQQGIGGDDSWGARPLPKYYIDNSKALELTFWLKGI